MYYSDKTIPFAPTLRPTINEFMNFRNYIFKVFSNPEY